MAYRIIKEFVEKLGDHHATTITGPLSPLLLLVPWSKNKEVSLDVLTINRGRESLMVVDEYCYHFFAEQKFREYFLKKVSHKELETAYYEYAAQSQVVYDQISSVDFSKIDEPELVSLLKKAIATFEPVADTVYIETLNYDMTLKVVGQENKSVLDVVWEQSIHPTFISFEGRRLAHLIDLVKKNKNISELIRKVKYIYTDYYWTKSDAEIEKALEDIKAHLDQKEKELTDIQQSAQIRKASFDSWKKSLSPNETFLVDYIQMIMLFRDIRKDPIAQMQAALVEIVTELLHRADIDPKYGRALNAYECVKGIEYLKNNKDEILKRAQGNISIIFLNGKIDVELCDYEKAVGEMYALISKSSTVSVDMIKGQIANKGKVTGKVRIVLDPHDDKGFQRGDILVTSMTRPEFVPLMKMAGAVVTNEGGITCHAAIVSRELNIPCVIGTKNATRVLKDGDMVEVDAERGIVTILK